MAKTDPSSTKLARAVQRKPGRPAAAQANKVSRDLILTTAYGLAKTVPLQDLSIVLVAKEMGVTPPLIHYYFGSRDLLTSGIMNLFYKDLLAAWPQATGRWDADVSAVATHIYEHFLTYSGVAAYAVSHNRFRVFQLVQAGEPDYGVEVLERYSATILKANLPPERTAVYAHLLYEFIMSSAYNTRQRRYPGEHAAFLRERTMVLSPEDYPAIHASTGPLNTLDGAAAFAEGRRLYLLGMQNEQLRNTAGA